MDPDLPVDFSSFGKEEEEARLDGMPAVAPTVDGVSVGLVGTPLAVNTPQPELAPPSTPSADGPSASAPLPDGPAASQAAELPAPATPATPATPASLSVEALVSGGPPSSVAAEPGRADGGPPPPPEVAPDGVTSTAVNGEVAPTGSGGEPAAGPAAGSPPGDGPDPAAAAAAKVLAAPAAACSDAARPTADAGSADVPMACVETSQAAADAAPVSQAAADVPAAAGDAAGSSPQPQPAGEASHSQAAVKHEQGRLAQIIADIGIPTPCAPAGQRIKQEARQDEPEPGQQQEAEPQQEPGQEREAEPEQEPGQEQEAEPEQEPGQEQEAGPEQEQEPEPELELELEPEPEEEPEQEPELESGRGRRPTPAPRTPPPPLDIHCLVCNEPLTTDECIQLADYLDNANVRVEEKLSNVINNDYRLYLHSEVVCDRCHSTLCEIHDLEVQSKQLKDQVVGFFWDTVEVRRVRPQRKGRRKSRPSKLLLEAQETAMFMPEVEMDIREDSPVIYKAPQKKLSRCTKPKCYEKLSHNEYQCIRCHKILPRMRAVTKHFDLVHGKKEEQCDICEKYFRDRPHLDRHKHKAHPEAMAELAAAAAAAAEAAAAAAAEAGTVVKQEAAEGEEQPGPATSAEPDEDDDDDDELIADRAPVIEDDDDADDAEVEEIDMDVVMNIEVERPRRGRKRRHSSRSSSMGNELGTMYTEAPDGSSPRFKCMLCPNTYSRPAKARDHFIAKHAQIKRFRCTLCSEMFLTYKQKRHHELSHTADECTKCGKKYPGNKRGMLERHVAQCGELKKCRVCGAEFESVAEFIKHRRDAHEKNATCDVCGKVVSARNLASHRAIHSDERNYTCHLCGSSFKAKGSLDTHLRTHSEDRPFSCATCGRSFKHRNNWKDHERGHLNIRDFVCHFCSKSFKQAKNLKQHLRQHDANPEIFTCPHCPSTFKYKYNMLAHVKTLHTGEMGRRVRRRMRAPSELSATGVAGLAGPGGHSSLVGLDPLQLSPGSVTSDSNSGAHAPPAPLPGRSVPQLNPLNAGVAFMQTLQHHSIFSS